MDGSTLLEAENILAFLALWILMERPEAKALNTQLHAANKIHAFPSPKISALEILTGLLRATP
jgi:hypothetical protein